MKDNRKTYQVPMTATNQAYIGSIACTSGGSVIRGPFEGDDPANARIPARWM